MATATRPGSKAALVGLVLLALGLMWSGPAAAQATTIGADPVVPFPIYSTDPDTPPGPMNLNATVDSSGDWTVTWDQPTDESSTPVAVDNYTVYWLDGSGFWQELTVDDAFTEAEIGAIFGAATVTVIANLDEEQSAAWEYLVLADPGSGPILPCRLVNVGVQPPPPDAWLDPSCLPT